MSLSIFSAPNRQPHKTSAAISTFYFMPPESRSPYDDFEAIPTVTMQDRHWYNPLADTTLTSSIIGSIHEALLADRNLLPLHYRHTRSRDETEAQIAAIKAVRSVFYHDVLCLGDPTNPNTKSFNAFKKKMRPDSLPPIGRFITAQRQFITAGLDATNLFARAPELYANSAKKNSEGIRTMTALGMSREEMTKLGYLFLVLSSDNIADKLNAMTSNGLDFTRIITKNGSAIGLSTERINRRVRTV